MACVRTGYSFRAAVGHLDDIAARIKDIGWTHGPITDRCSTFGFNRWTKACAKHGLQPVYGVELAVTRELGAKKPILDYWTFIARDDISALHDLIWLATSNPGREPSLTYSQAQRAEGVFKIAGHRCDITAITGDDLVFLGLSPATPRGLFRKWAATSWPVLAVPNNFFPLEKDREFYRVTLGRFADNQSYHQHIVSDEEWYAALGWIDDTARASAISNRDYVLGKSKATLKKATLLHPDRPATLLEMCQKGAEQLGVDLSDPVYAARLERELGLIAEKQFEDYFYIIADMVMWAKQRMVVGPARGSSCGSLACYLLGITSIDPIPYGLIFERFIDTTRADLPDIDLDFSDERRQLVFDYVEGKYGSERVARLGTVGMFKPKSALNQAGIALKVPRWQIERVSDNIIQRSSGDSRAMQQLEDTLKDTAAGRTLLEQHPNILIAAGMEGHPNVASQHAAGIVVTQEPVRNYVAVDARTKSAMCDKKDAEDLNLLKIDALGLTQLSIFERTLQLIGQPDRTGFLESLPTDDRDAFDVLNKGHFAGIFQFMGGALKSLTKQVHINKFDDIVNITALARPGPMASGGANTWVKRRTGREPVSFPHPLFEPYLSETLGIVIYQEQVLQIGREIGDLTWAQVTALRKAMSKSLGKEFFNQFGDPWKAAAMAKGIPAEVLDKVWDDLCAYGAWSFNKSHAVAYGLVSYWCCWLKAHHPVEFAAATLDAEKDPARQIALLKELSDEGITYVPIDPDHSTDRWEPKGNTLIGPLTNVKGLGPASVLTILESRRTGNPLRPAIKKKLVAAKTEIDTLFPVRDRVKQLYPDLSAANILTEPTNIIDAQCGLHGDVVIIGVARKIAPKDENEAVNVAKRGGRVLSGPSAALNLFIRDDTDEIFCKIDRFKFEQMGKAVVERGRAGKAIYAIKGTIPPEFRMIKVKAIRYIGDMDDEVDARGAGKGKRPTRARTELGGDRQAARPHTRRGGKQALSTIQDAERDQGS